jgi:uncharacterized protein (DUF697 family)
MSEKAQKAQEIVGSYWKWAAAAGVLPPLIDVAVVTGIQVKMIADLARLYYPDIQFKNEWGKSVVGALVGSVSPPFLANASLRLLGPVLKVVPVVGTFAGLIAIPAFNAATTRALGTVFREHFELGGNLFDFDPDKVRAHFKKEFESAARQPGGLVTAGA